MAEPKELFTHQKKMPLLNRYTIIMIVALGLLSLIAVYGYATDNKSGDTDVAETTL